LSRSTICGDRDTPDDVLDDRHGIECARRIRATEFLAREHLEPPIPTLHNAARLGRPDVRMSGWTASGARSIQELQEIVGRELDLLVSPFCGAVMARDQAGAVEATEVSVDEGVSRLSLI
jgi:hypothetical protein